MIFTFDSSQVGAPVLSGSAGALRTLLKACLVDGFGAGAVATLTDEQRALMQQSDKGEVTVAVQVSDESGAQPIECEFIWAWVPASKSKTSAPAAPAATPQR